MSVITRNKRASFDYEIREKYEAGLVLLGHEAKAVKAGQVSLKGSFISIRTKDGRTELFLINAQISPYKQAGPLPNYNQLRERKLLLKRQEIDHLIGKKSVEGLTLIPLKIYTNHSFVKLEFAVAKGKKKHDKRESIKKRELDRRLQSLVKNR